MSAASKSRALEPLLDFQRRTVQLAAEEVRELDQVWIARTPSLPSAWWVNQVRVRRAIDYGSAAALCARHLPPSPFDVVVLEHQDGAEALVQSFLQQGWEAEIELNMELLARADPEPAAIEVVPA